MSWWQEENGVCREGNAIWECARIPSGLNKIGTFPRFKWNCLFLYPFQVSQRSHSKVWDLMAEFICWKGEWKSAHEWNVKLQSPRRRLQLCKNACSKNVDAEIHGKMVMRKMRKCLRWGCLTWINMNQNLIWQVGNNTSISNVSPLKLNFPLIFPRKIPIRSL